MSHLFSIKRARNKTASDEIIGFIRDYFKSLDFVFTNVTQARIISGEEEAINGWTAINYIQSNFKVFLLEFSNFLFSN